MCKTVSKLTVFFDSPFWAGVYEREYNDSYEVCKVVFGSEPKDYEVYDFMLKNWNQLKFSPSIQSEKKTEKHFNSKRLQREISKELQNTGIGTKAQQALKLQHEQNKTSRKTVSRKMREEEKKKMFELKQQKRKLKHRGH